VSFRIRRFSTSSDRGGKKRRAKRKSGAEFRCNGRRFIKGRVKRALTFGRRDSPHRDIKHKGKAETRTIWRTREEGGGGRTRTQRKRQGQIQGKRKIASLKSRGLGEEATKAGRKGEKGGKRDIGFGKEKKKTASLKQGPRA